MRLAQAVTVCVGALTSSVLLTSAQPAGAASCNVGVGLNIVAPGVNLAVRLGDSVAYVVEATLIPGDCPISNGTVTLTLPNGTVQTLATGVSITPSATMNVTDDFDEQTPDYVVSSADVQANDTIMASAFISATATESTMPLITQKVTQPASYGLPLIHVDQVGQPDERPIPTVRHLHLRRGQRLTGHELHGAGTGRHHGFVDRHHRQQPRLHAGTGNRQRRVQCGGHQPERLARRR